MSGEYDGEEEELVPEDDAIIGRAFRLSVVVILSIGALVAAAVLILGGEDEGPPPVEQNASAPESRSTEVQLPRVSFRDVTAAAGIDFVHHNGARGDKLLPETMGGGVAFFDLEGDGDPDLCFANSAPWPENAEELDLLPTSKVYRNDSGGNFTDVTAQLGLAETFYGMGVSAADVDGSGTQDLYFTAVGANRFYSQEDGRFRAVERGIAGAPDEWSTAAAFFDADRDGDLDLYVGNYVRWSREIDFEVDYRLTGIGRSYGPPANFEGTHSRFYLNDGQGSFADASAASGIQVENPVTGRPSGKALGVRPFDVDENGALDLFVANDTVQNFFFLNAGDGSFTEQGSAYGIAFDRNGKATGAMGIDGAWYRNDGDVGFALGNFANEMSSLYVSQGVADLFSDESIGEGIGAPSRKCLSFGIFFFDYDLDGRLDLLQANGHLEDEINRVQPSQHYAQPAQLFWNGGDAGRSSFLEVPADTTGDLARPIVGRGASYADIDGDGDLDVVLTQTGGPPLLLRNEGVPGRHWIRLRIRGPAGNPEAIGARVELGAGGVVQRRQVVPTRSYLSQVEATLTFGLGAAETVDRVRVVWPDGTEAVFDQLRIDSVNELSKPGH